MEPNEHEKSPLEQSSYESVGRGNIFIFTTLGAVLLIVAGTVLVLLFRFADTHSDTVNDSEVVSQENLSLEPEPDEGVSFDIFDSGVRILDASSGEVLQTILLREIPMRNPRDSFTEVYGSEIAMEREQHTSPAILTHLDVNNDGHTDLGILVDTGPIERGYVFYIYDDAEKVMRPAILDNTESGETFVVYKPSMSDDNTVLQGMFTVTNPRRRDYVNYTFDHALGVFVETKNAVQTEIVPSKKVLEE